jgi:hypothetical protein
MSNSAVRFTITGGGNVGIGTASPSSKLQVGLDETAFISIANGGSTNVTSGINWLYGSGQVNGGGIEMGAPSANNFYMIFKTRNSGSTAERMRITSGGNVLVGTTTDVGSPYRLQVNGRIQLYGAELIFSGDENKSINVFSNRSLTLSTNDTARLTITGSGNVGIGTTSPQRKFVVSNGGNSGLEISASTGHSTIISYNRGISANQPLVLQESGGGNVGIGTDNPSVRLEVNGEIKTSAPTGGTAQAWKLGNYNPLTDTATGHVLIEVNGVQYKVLVYT